MLKNIKGSLRKKIQKYKGVKKQYPEFFMREPKVFVSLPSFKDQTKVDFRYPLLEPFVYAHIKWVPEDKKLLYIVEEPRISKSEREMVDKIENNLIEIIDVKISEIRKTGRAVAYIEDKIKGLLNDMGIKITHEQYLRVIYYVIRDFVGLNEIEPFMHDPYIEDVGCTGIGSHIFIIHKKFGSIETSLVYKDFDYFSNFVIKLAERCGRYISYAVPLLDGSLPDGSRVQASLTKDVTTKGPTFSIRKFRKNPFSPVDLVNLKTSSAKMMAYLWFLMHHDVSVLITGGVSTGKTTTLNVLSMFIPPEDKIISIEDTREINLPHENWIPSVSRAGFGVPEAGGKKYGEISLFDLLKESFRQNPDYVIVGEIRGQEAYVMFQGMASGHPSLGTVHAGSVDDVIKRLETPPIGLSPTLIESLDLILVMVNAKEKGKSARKIKEIIEIQSMDPRTGRAHFIKTFSWIASVDNFRGSIENSEIIRRVSFSTGVSYSEIISDIENRERVIKWMMKHDIIHFSDVYKILNLYEKDKKTVMGWVNNDTEPKKIKTKSRELISATGLKIIKT